MIVVLIIANISELLQFNVERKNANDSSFKKFKMIF